MINERFKKKFLYVTAALLLALTSYVFSQSGDVSLHVVTADIEESKVLKSEEIGSAFLFEENGSGEVCSIVHVMEGMFYAWKNQSDALKELRNVNLGVFHAFLRNGEFNVIGGDTVERSEAIANLNKLFIESAGSDRTVFLADMVTCETQGFAPVVYDASGQEYLQIHTSGVLRKVYEDNFGSGDIYEDAKNGLWNVDTLYFQIVDSLAELRVPGHSGVGVFYSQGDVGSDNYAGGIQGGFGSEESGVAYFKNEITGNILQPVFIQSYSIYDLLESVGIGPDGVPKTKF